MAQSLVHAAARQGYDVLFITQTQLMASKRTAKAMRRVNITDFL